MSNTNSIFFNSLNLKVSENSSHQQQQQQQQHSNYVTNNQMNKTASSFTSSSNTSPNDRRTLISHNDNKSKNLVYDYIKGKEVLLKPNEIIASVV